MSTVGHVIAYIPEEKSIPELSMVCMLLKLRFHRAGKAELGKSPAEILAGAGRAAGETAAGETRDAEGFLEPMLVLCGLSGELMNRFLSELKKRGVRIPLKAALTETNAAWELSRLYGELRDEHRAMTGEEL